MWARFWETFGEDPYLASVMGASFVRGLEGQDIADEKHVAASLKLADRAYVLENGQIRLEGSGAELMGDPKVREAYLGL